MTSVKNYFDALSMAAEARTIYENFEENLIAYLESTNYSGTDFGEVMRENHSLRLSGVNSRQTSIPKNRPSFWVNEVGIDPRKKVKYHPRPNRDRIYYVEKKDKKGHHSLTLKLEVELSPARILDTSNIRRTTA